MATNMITAARGRWCEILSALAGLRPEQLCNRHQPTVREEVRSV